MKNKKGATTLLPEETLKIILAIICIILLLILSAKLFSIFIAKTKTEQAKATLEIITGKIEQVKKDNAPVSLIINSPKDYHLFLAEGKYCKTAKYCLCFAPKERGTEGMICKITEDFIRINGLNDGDIRIDKSKSVTITKTTNEPIIIDLIEPQD